MAESFERGHWHLIIGNAKLAAEDGGWAVVRDPSNNAQLAEVPSASEADVDAAVSAARSAFDGGKWGRTAGAKRSHLMLELARLLRENFGELSKLESRNNGKAISSTKGEIGQAISELEFYAGAATKIMGETVPTPHGFVNYTVREPLGVCALIVPWNYPFMLAMRKVAPALAAGNAVVLKPATSTPLTALVMGELAIEAGFPEGALNVITGPGRTAGNALVTHPGVDKVSFTGSTENGREILRAAADDFRRVTLELGGKSPNLVFDDADLDHAIPGSVWSIFYSAGQSCEARSRLLVQQGIFDDFVNRFVKATESLRVGDPMDPDTHVGAIVSDSHLQTIRNYIQSAVDAGGKVLTGGRAPEGERFESGNWLLPTVITGVSNDHIVCQEEIFGPVVTIVPFETEREAIAMANDSIYGLAATVWTSDAKRAMRVPSAIRSGVVTVNQPFTVFPGTPFGGYKQSGWGREASLDALDDYTEKKSVVAYSGERPVDPFGLG